MKGAAKFIAVKEAYEALVRIFEEEEKTKAARPRRSPREKQAGGPPGGATRADPGTKTGGASRREDEPVDELLRSFDALVKGARAADYPFPVGHKFGIRRRALADFAGAARRVGLLGQRLERWNAIRPSIIELLERARLAGAAAPTEAILAPDGLEQFRRHVVQTEDAFAQVRRLQIRRSKLAERANAASYPGQIASDEDVDHLARSSVSEANAELDKLEASVTYWSDVRSEALALQARIPAAGGQVDLRLCLGPNGLSGFRQAVAEAEASAQPRSPQSGPRYARRWSRPGRSHTRWPARLSDCQRSGTLQGVPRVRQRKPLVGVSRGTSCWCLCRRGRFTAPADPLRSSAVSGHP